MLSLSLDNLLTSIEANQTTDAAGRDARKRLTFESKNCACWRCDDAVVILSMQKNPAGFSELIPSLGHCKKFVTFAAKEAPDFGHQLPFIFHCTGERRAKAVEDV